RLRVPLPPRPPRHLLAVARLAAGGGGHGRGRVEARAHVAPADPGTRGAHRIHGRDRVANRPLRAATRHVAAAAGGRAAVSADGGAAPRRDGGRGRLLPGPRPLELRRLDERAALGDLADAAVGADAGARGGLAGGPALGPRPGLRAAGAVGAVGELP